MLQTESPASYRPASMASLPLRPLFSVLVASYNYERYVANAITSVLEQDYDCLELVVCDDGSTDNSRAIIEEFALRDPRVKGIYKGNGGMASALNAAYAASSGAVICLLDADDLFDKSKLRLVLQRFSESADIGLVVHKLQKITASGESYVAYPHQALSEGWLGAMLLNLTAPAPTLPPCSGLCLRREIADLCFPIPDVFRSGADQYVQLTAALLSRTAAINCSLARWRIHGSNMTSRATWTSHGFRKALDNSELMWRHVRSFYLRHVNGIDLPSESPTYDTAFSRYMCALAEADPRCDDAYCALARHPGFLALPHLRRFVYRSSRLLPRLTFFEIIRLLDGDGPIKRSLLRLLRHS